MSHLAQHRLGETEVSQNENSVCDLEMSALQLGSI
jgi:hypothetical protein